MSSPTSRSARRRLVHAHSCPECRAPWALRGARDDNGSWLIACSVCDWQRVVLTLGRSITA